MIAQAATWAALVQQLPKPLCVRGQEFYGVLVQHFALRAGAQPLPLGELDALTVHLLALTPEVCSRLLAPGRQGHATKHFCNRVAHMHSPCPWAARQRLRVVSRCCMQVVRSTWAPHMPACRLKQVSKKPNTVHRLRVPA